MKVFRLVMPLFFMVSSVFATNKSVKVIYDQDNRKDMVDVQSNVIRELSKAVAGRVSKWSYDYLDEEKNGDIFFYEPPKLSDPWGENVCSDEKFAQQPVIVDCTGFLVGEDLLVTAGHCAVYHGDEVKNKMTDQCQDNQWLFDYELNREDNLDLQKVNKKKLYNCKKIIYARLDDVHDFALIQLDRKVKDRKYLKVRNSGKIKKNEGLYVIGHPSGLPKKYSPGAKVLNNSQEFYFSTNLDTFGGNSGSPVFNVKTNEVEGILVRGKTDYIESTKPGETCMRANKCNARGKKCSEDDGEIDGEQVTRISELINFL